MKRKVLHGIKRPAVWILSLLPEEWVYGLCVRIFKNMAGKAQESEKQRMERSREFVICQTAILFWSMLLLCAGVGMGAVGQKKRNYAERNSFGKGEKEVSLFLKKDGETKEFPLVLEERALTAEEMERVSEDFFAELKKSMCGNNASLEQVSQNLRFVEALEGYPFQITYEPEEPEYIDLQGKLGKKVSNLEKNQSLSTRIHVTAIYEDYQIEHTFPLTFIAEKKEKSPFAEAVSELKEIEKNSRDASCITFPAAVGNVKVGIEEEKSFFGGLLLCLGCIPCLIVIRHVFSLKEDREKRRKETMRDFSLIIHLMALYMGAGLSFASAVHRIVLDYQNREKKKRKRYAFEQMAVMDRQMKMGVSQKEACLRWGRRFEDNLYQQLSTAIMQSLSKGARETGIFLENMEREAFRQRIDHARKEGEKASARLLFPMMILLCLVIAIVMFPAIVRFQSF